MTAGRGATDGTDWRTALMRPGVRVGLLALLFAAFAVFEWRGLGAGDEAHYIEAAFKWRDQGLYLGTDHWELRHLLVLPIVGAFAAFGPGEHIAIIPNLLYAAGLVFLTYHFGRRHLGEGEAFAAAAFVAASGFFVSRPLELDVYGVEIFFAALAGWLFIDARRRARYLPVLFISGLVAGLAWTVRESALSLPLAIGLLTLASFERRILAAAVFSAGFFCVIFAELIVYGIAAADPFYRYVTDLGHRGASTAAQMQVADSTSAGRISRAVKDTFTTPLTTPFLFAAIGVAWIMRRTIWKGGVKSNVPLAFAAMAVLAMAICMFPLNLSHPRYYPMMTYAATIALAIGAAALTRRYGFKAFGLALGAYVIANLAVADVRRYGEYAEARALAARAAQSGEAIYTDFSTANRAQLILALAGSSMADAEKSVVGVAAPPDGAMFFKSYRVRAGSASWCRLSAEVVRPPSWTRDLLKKLGFDRRGPAALKAILQDPPPVELFRATPTAQPVDPVSGAPCLPATPKKK